MIKIHAKLTIHIALIALFFFQVPFAGAFNFDSGTDYSSSSQSLDSCAGLSDSGSSLSTSLGCDSDDIIDFTTYSGDFEGPNADGYDEALTRNTNARDFIQTVVNYALSFLGLFAVIMVIYGGVLYVLSRGDEDMASKGKKTISYSAIGILIVLGSFAIVNTLIQAGGGDGAGGGIDGSGGAGTAIAEAGANFDVEDVLGELESITNEFVSAYDTFVEIKTETLAMNSLELPYILSLSVNDTGVSSWGDALASGLSGGSWDPEDYEDIYDISGLNEFIAYMTDGARNVQVASDSRSNAYFAASEVINYLTTDSTLLDYTKNDSNLLNFWPLELLSTLSGRLFPSAKAESDYVDYFTNQYSPGSCSSLTGEYTGTVEDRTSVFTFIGSTEYETSTEVLYDYVCTLIDYIDAAALDDYQSTISDLEERLDQNVIALFEDSGLNGINQSLSDLKSTLNGAKKTLNVDTLQQFVSDVEEAYLAIENVQFVAVSLDVSKTQGNAPLLVTFDVVGTEDPTGKTVNADNIEWDLDGDGVYNSPLDRSLNGGEAATGYSVKALYTEEKSYRVRVRVKSSSDEVASGVATLTVNVEAPRSKISLVARTNGYDTVLADFSSDNKFEYIDKDSYRVTTAEAQAGIQFDISASTDGNGGELEYVQWDFGDSDFAEGPWSGELLRPIRYYSEGTYELSLTVTDSSGIEDRKYFTLYVGSPAARINYSPESGAVGTEFKFDGSGSSTDVGNIVSYSWSISRDEGPILLDDSSSSVIEHTFDAPGVYDVQLQVVDGAYNTDTASISLLVESQPPVADFECKIMDENKPSTLTCDANDSYDPDGDDLIYEWDFDSDNYEIIEGDETSNKVKLRYNSTGSYNIALTVKDDYEQDLQQSDITERTYTVDSVLELSFDLKGDAAINLDSQGEVELEFQGETTGTSLELDCGNNTSDYSGSLSRGTATLNCKYSEAGVYIAKMTAYDDENNFISDSKRVYIGSGDSPIAVIQVDGNGEDISFDGNKVYGNVKTKFTFDASDSVNIDGSDANLTYSWNFGNGKTSASKNVTTVFDEVADYEVVLRVRDKNDTSIYSETSVLVSIQPLEPKLTGISIVPQADSLETPLKVKVKVDAKDEDGEIEYIKAWYYDLNDTAEALGAVIAQADEFSMTINTKGEEGEEVDYGFAVEVTDSDNLTVRSEDVLSPDEVPKLTVINGPNDSPEANFSVDFTSVYIGDEVTFINESFDPDGEILYSWWDIGADGTYNDEALEGAESLSYTFTQVYPDGIDVRLKVEDDAGATDTSDTIRIYVDTLADPPDARFLTDIYGTTVQFINNSYVDTENGASLQGIYWDFDLSKDTDGNGVPNDDFDSFEENPKWTYEELGSYQVMMTVVDSAGQTDTVTKDIEVLDTDDPTASFTYTLDEKKVQFKNESQVDEEKGVEVRSYIWDFDLNYDADGDGNSENDVDSNKKSPTVEYDDYGDYEVSLTIVDSYGKSDVYKDTVEVKNPVQPVKAVLTGTPQINSNNQIILTGTEADITFFFSAEGGSGKFTYTFDKNIFYDTDKDGLRDNDIDYQIEDSGSWTTRFYESYGTIVVEMTVIDEETGESDSATVQVIFEGSLGAANLINATPRDMALLILSALIAAIGGVSLLAFKPSFKK